MAAARRLDNLPFQVAATSAELRGWRDFPAVIKPVDSQGQRGLALANDYGQLRRAFGASAACSRAGRVIVERFVPGDEFSLLAFFHGGRRRHSFLIDRLVAGAPTLGIATGHRFPSRRRRGRRTSGGLGRPCGCGPGDPKRAPLLSVEASRRRIDAHRGRRPLGRLPLMEADRLCDGTRSSRLFVSIARRPRLRRKHRPQAGVRALQACLQSAAAGPPVPRRWAHAAEHVVFAVVLPTGSNRAAP